MLLKIRANRDDAQNSRANRNDKGMMLKTQELVTGCDESLTKG